MNYERIANWNLGVVLCGILALGACEADRPDAPPPVLRTAGMVAANHPLAAEAGYEILQKGGNAVDAAVATAAALGSVEPYLSGIGGDGIAAVYLAERDQVYVLNFSGRAPAALTVEHFPDGIPSGGGLVSLVPGALMGWETMRERFGTMSLQNLLQPAIQLAEEGYQLTQFAAEQHASVVRQFHDHDGAGAAAWWGGDDSPPGVGGTLSNPRLAEVYRQIGAEGIDVFYGGPLGRMIVDHNRDVGGVMTLTDLAEFQVEWQEPVRSSYRGYDLMLAPPNSSGGIATAQILNMLEHYDLAAKGVNSAGYIHTLVEAIKLAAADRAEWSADPDYLDRTIPIQRLVSKEYAAERHLMIHPDRAAGDVAAGIERGGTTHLSVVDRWGNMVSMVATLGSSWGSGVVAGETGIILNNGIRWFELDPESPAVVEGGKRTRWNMTPVVVARDGKPFMVVGTPGGTGIWQTLPQVITKMVDFGKDIEEAIESPRFRWAMTPALLVRVEDRVPSDVLDQLRRKGHQVQLYPAFTMGVGGVNGIRVDHSSGTLVGGADPRRDGAVAGGGPLADH